IVTTPEMVKIIAYKPEGISSGVQTLRQLLPADIEKDTVVTNVEWSAPASIIDDKPEYEYRGLMIDVARHFFTVDEVKRQIDLASAYKINKVHLHLTNDQGWRIEIKKWPDLTTIGGSLTHIHN
ncbi:family 20 glycosylhydrolase, partial [Clostridium perfringens]|nr:family 20 glycosylhydrolase [Clostridium perfringens]